MLTRELRASKPLYQLSKFGKAYVRYILDDAWENGSCHVVLDQGEVQVEHIREAMRAFHGGLLSISYFVTDDEKVSVTVYR